MAARERSVSRARRHAEQWLTLVLVLVLSACSSGGTKTEGSSSPSLAATSTPPSVDPSPTRAPCPYFDRGGGRCLGPVAAGTYTTEYFLPAITYTVPTGWDNAEDQHGSFVLVPPEGDLNGVDAGTSDFIGVYSTVAAPNGCKAGPAPGVGTTATAVASWMTRDPSLVVTDKRAIKLGGLSGVVMDLAISARAKPCPYSGGKPVAPYLFGVDLSVGVEHNTGPGAKTRMYVLNNDGGALAVEVVDVHGGDHLDGLSAIVHTMSFAS